jgi:acetylglutamate kinase
MTQVTLAKVGGNIIDDPHALEAFLKQFATLKGPKVLVHGGGKLATKVSETMQLKVNMVDGRRITDAPTLDVVTMVYSGKINTSIVAKLQAFGCNAIGFSGSDGQVIEAVKRPIQTIDYGFVGDVVTVHPKTLKLLLNNNITPVFCALTADNDGQLLNTNADTIAAELAIGLSQDFETVLYYCFEKNGVLRDINDDQSTITHITPDDFETLQLEGVVSEGMLPKLNNCFHAVKHNVSKVCLGQPDMLFNPNYKFTTITQ